MWCLYERFFFTSFLFCWCNLNRILKFTTWLLAVFVASSFIIPHDSNWLLLGRQSFVWIFSRLFWFVNPLKCGANNSNYYLLFVAFSNMSNHCNHYIYEIHFFVCYFYQCIQMGFFYFQLVDNIWKCHWLQRNLMH